MWTWITDFATRFWHDEAFAQRCLAMALFGLGQLLASGGVIPGTDTVIPGLAPWAEQGKLVQLLGIYLGAGGVAKRPGA